MIVQIEMNVGPKEKTGGFSGKTHSQEAKDAVSDYRTGKKATLETRRKMRDSHVSNGGSRIGGSGYTRKDYCKFLECTLHYFDSHYKYLFI